MTQTEPDGGTRGIRRLTKQPGTSAQPRHVEDKAQAPSDSAPELYFEPLPTPWAETNDSVDEAGDLSVPPAEAEPVPPSEPLPSKMQQPFTEEPTLYFRHSSPARPAQVPPDLPEQPLSPRPERKAVSREALPASSTSSEVRLRSTPERRQEAEPAPAPKVATPARPADQTGPWEGDPIAAYARPSSVVRSRPSRPSGTFAVARSSGQVPTARVGGEVPTARYSEVTERSATETTASLPSRSSSASLEIRADSSVDIPPASSNKDEAAPLRGGGKGKAIVGMMFASVVLVAYAFEIGPLEEAADAASRQWTSGSASVMAGVLPWLLVLPAVALFGVIVWLLFGMIGLRRPGKKRSKAPKEKKPRTPLDHFKQSALRAGVDNRTAYRGWRLLEAACGGDRVFTVDSSLMDDLALTAREVRAVHLQLLNDLLRVSDPAMRLPATETVLDLLRAVETAPMAKPSANSGEVPIPGDPGQRRRKDSTAG